MRRVLLPLLVVMAVLSVSAPASASATSRDEGWTPAPSAPWTLPAGARCDFAVHGDPIVDEVVQKVLNRDSQGRATLVAYKGALVIRVTNTETGAAYDADASGNALVRYGADGSQFWTVSGPILVGVAKGAGNLPRGLYIIDGNFTLRISPTGYKTVGPAHATVDDICAHVA